MRSLVALFVLFLLASPILPFLSHSVTDAGADSFPRWNKVFHLHDGAYLSSGKYDWMNSSGPYNPTSIDYDSDGLPGITIKKNVPPQRYHSWNMYPPVKSQMNLSGSLAAYVWAKSQGNESGTVVQATFYDITVSQFADPTLGTLIGTATSSLVGPYYSEFQLVSLVIPSVSYTLPANHLLCLVLERGDSINDWLIVHYDRTDYDSFVALTTDRFISMDSAWAEDSTGVPKGIYSDLEDVVMSANISNPFGAYDIYGAYATVYYSGTGTEVVSQHALSLVATDPSTLPYWKLFKGTLPDLGAGNYVANVSARDNQGYPSWSNVSFTVVSVDHFDVVAPAIVTSGSSFALNLTARDAANQVVTDWVGPVQLSAYSTDKVTEAIGTLSITSVQFNTSDLGQVNISDESFNFSEEQIFIKATAGPRFGWSGLIIVRSGPVVAVDISLPSPQIIVAGGNKSFSVVGRDSLGNVNTTWTPFWNVTASIGTIDIDGLFATFFASGAGVGNITCRNNATEANDTVWIIVTSGTLARINITSTSYPMEIREGMSQALTATGYDEFDNPVSIAGAVWGATVGSVVGSGSSATYYAGYVPINGAIECRLGSITGSLDVRVLTSLSGVSFKDLPVQSVNEDTVSWEQSLTGFWQRDGGTDKCFWWVEGVDYSLYFILHDSQNNNVMRFFTQPDRSGDDEFTLWAIDQDGYTAFTTVRVNIIPINDAPTFVNNPPTEIFVTFDTEYTFDYSYYVDDVDNEKSDLTMSSDAGANIWFESLEAHFNYTGKSSYFEFVEISVKDPSDAVSRLSIVVKVTRDIPPSLNTSLPDVVIYEGVMNFFAFDLDEYFYDLDGQVLIYTTGFENIPAPFINATTHRVYFSAPGEWSGVTIGTFTATDPEGALKVDTVNVTVIAVNDAPTIGEINKPIYVHYGQAYYLYLSSYVNDPDNPMDALTIQINDTHIIRSVGPTGAHRLEMNFPANLTGPLFDVYSNPYRVWVSMNVTDPIGEMASIEFQIVVTDSQPPQVVAENPDQLYVTFPEDTYLNDTMRLYNYIRDPDDSTLNFTITSTGSNVRWEIDSSSGYVSLSASENWSGTETLSITGRDPSGGWAFVKVNVIVTPVNDPPVILMYLKDMIVTGGPRSTQYDISGVFYDNDSEYLIIIATPEGYAQVVGTTLFVSLPSGEDVITVTLRASDREFETSLIVFKVGVKKTIAERIGYPFTLPLVLLAAGVAGYFIGIRLPRPFALENLFLIHNDGRLVSHVTKEENTTLDKDVVSAMFTAVQEFVRDSFQKGEVGLKRLEIGDKSVMIEKGKSAYLALIYSGYPQKEVFEMLPVLLRDIEERYKDKLGRWNGTLKAVPGVEKMLQEYMASSFKPGTWHEEEEIAEEEWVDILNKEA